MKRLAQKLETIATPHQEPITQETPVTMSKQAQKYQETTPSAWETPIETPIANNTPRHSNDETSDANEASFARQVTNAQFSTLELKNRQQATVHCCLLQ